MDISECDSRYYNSLPDAFLVSCANKETIDIDWWDVEVVGEYSKTADEVETKEASQRTSMNAYSAHHLV